MNAWVINGFILLFVVFANCLIPVVSMNELIETALFNSIAVFVGVSIAVVGIFLGSINSIYLTLFQLIKQKSDTLSDNEIRKIKSQLDGISSELKENSLFSLFGFSIIVIFFFFKELDIPYISWFVDESILSKVMFLNICICLIYGFVIHAVIDTTIVIFKVSTFFQLSKQE